MKKLPLWSFVVVAALSLLSCPQAGLQNPYENLEPGSFWAINMKTNEYYAVDSVLLAEGDKCLVWAERSAGVSVDAGKDIAYEYDHNIYEKIVEAFGSEAIMTAGDVDKNGKLTLLLLDIKDDFKVSGAYTAGYFDGRDFLANGSYAHSNERDMLYVDTYPSTPRSPAFYATIAHEFQHFINYTARTRILGKASGMDTWIDEGLSAAAEYIYLGNHNTDRVRQFTLSDSVREGNNFFVWGNRPDKLLDDYSTVYLFFQWLRIQSGGTEIYKRIIESQESDYRAVTGAITGAFAGALAAELGSTSWETVLCSWLAANYLNSSGLYGYDGKLPEVKVFALGGATWQLLPGEGVYSMVGASPGALPSGGDPHIRYAGLRERGPADSSPAEPGVSRDALYPKGRLLTFNGNEQKSGWKEEGLLTGEDGETMPQFRSSGRSVEPGSWNPGDSWIIDAWDILGRQGR
jgi:hypothetical protein